MISGEAFIQIKNEILDKIKSLTINSEFRIVEYLYLYELEAKEEFEISIDILSELINFGYCREVDMYKDVIGLPKNILLKKIK